MELAYLAELRDDALVLRERRRRHARHSAASRPASRCPREHSWCHAMVAGERAAAGHRRRRAPAAAAHPFVPRPASAPTPACPCAARTARCSARSAASAARRSRELGERDLRYLYVLARMAARAARGRGGREPGPPRRGRGRRRPGADRRAQRARELHRRALRGRARAGARGRRRAGAWTPRSATAVGQVALLHDIGKVGVPDAILRKPRRADRARVGRHARAPGDRRADRRARSARSRTSRPPCGPSTSAGTAAATRTASPARTSRSPSRICFVCDAWHAMTSDRPYRRALTADEARVELRAQRRHAVLPDDGRRAAARARPRRRARPRAAARRGRRPRRCRGCAPTGRWRPSCAR